MDDEQQVVRALVGRAAGGDPDAWEALYRRAYARLFAFARRRLPTDEAADDAVSEVMTRALDRIGGFTWQGAGFDAWLFGILRNVVHEAHRNRPRRGHEPPDLPSPDRGPLEQVVADEQRDVVRRAFETLGPDDREVLELRIVGELSADAVGEVLGKRAGAVRMAQSRALDRLRNALREVSGAE